MKTILKQVLFLLFLIPALTWAQTKVSGTITDGLTGMPLGGVNVIIKDTSQGTSSDFDGNYTINTRSSISNHSRPAGFILQGSGPFGTKNAIPGNRIA